jgi:hypothetical protein
MDHDAEAREQKAFRRLTAAARTLAKGTGHTALVEEISSAYHQDPNVRNMRRTEAIANYLEALAAPEKPESKTAKGRTTKTEETEKAAE